MNVNKRPTAVSKVYLKVISRRRKNTVDPVFRCRKAVFVGKECVPAFAGIPESQITQGQKRINTGIKPYSELTTNNQYKTRGRRRKNETMLFRGQQDSFQAREDLILDRQKLRQGGKAVSRSFSDHFLSVHLELEFF